jgi:DNA repair exonuclease SbcCD ATPase subunit
MNTITILSLLVFALAGITIAAVTMWSRSDKRHMEYVKFVQYDVRGYEDMLQTAIEERDQLRSALASLKEYTETLQVVADKREELIENYRDLTECFSRQVETLESRSCCAVLSHCEHSVDF